MPSSRSQIAVTVSWCSARSKSGAASRARSANSFTAASASQRRQPQLPLVPDPQRQLAGHQDTARRRLVEEFGDRRRALDDLLEVVEHEQHRSCAQTAHDRLALPAALRVADLQRSGDRWDQRVGLAYAGERDEPDPALECRQQALRRREREARLARAAEAEDRHEPLTAGQHVPQRLQLGLATDQPPRVGRQIGRPDGLGPQRREVARTALVVEQQPEPLGRGKVLQPVLSRRRPARSPSASNARVAAETTTWPPCPAAAMRAARCTSSPP